MTSMRSPLSPPNHQSSTPASQTERTERASLPSASCVVATTVTSPELPGDIEQIARQRLWVVDEQVNPRRAVRIWLSSASQPSLSQGREVIVPGVRAEQRRQG